MMKSPLLSLCAPIRQGVTAWLLVLLAVPLLALSNAVQAADFIQITTTVPTAQEPSAVASVRNGVVSISRAGQDVSADLFVFFTIAPIDTTYTGFTVTSPATNFTYNYTSTGTSSGTGGGSGVIDIPAGTDTGTINIVPFDNLLINGYEVVNISLVPNAAYNFNGNGVTSVVVAEGDLNLIAGLPVPVAYKQSLPGYTFDVQAARRGVLAATFSFPTIYDPTSSPVVPQGFDKSLAAQFSGTAVVGTDYNLSYKITGSTPTGGQPGPGFGNYLTGQSGDGYNVVSYLVGEGGGSSNPVALPYSESISIITTSVPAPPVAGTTPPVTIPVPGDLVSFSDTSGLVYQVVSFNGSALVLNPPLEANLHNAAAMTDLSNASVTGYTVNFPYPAGSGFGGGQTGSIKVEAGHNQFHYGDAIQFANDPAFYVVTSFTPGPVITSDGAITIRAYENSNYYGLGVAITSNNDAITSSFPVTLNAFGQTPLIIIAAESTQIQFGVTPIDSGTPTGMRQATMQLIGNSSFALANPAVATVDIADDASTAAVVAASNGTSPGNGNASGNFLVTFTQAFPQDIVVPYAIIDGPGSPANIGADYTLSSLTETTSTTGYGSVILPAGATSISIPVFPSGTIISGPETITLALSPSLDYLLASGATTTFNPTATLDLLPSNAFVGVVASTPNGTPSIPVPANQVNPQGLGVFTIETSPLVSLTNSPLLINFSVTATPFNAPSGSTFVPVLGTDYTIQTLVGTQYTNLTPTTGTTPTFQVTIPIGASSAQVFVSPQRGSLASASFQVSAAIAPGAGYQPVQTPLAPSGLVVTVVPQLVTAAALNDTSIGGSVVTNFAVSATGADTVTFSFPTAASQGAVYGTDFTASFPATSGVTVTPVSGSTGTFTATFPNGGGTQPISITGLADPAITTYPLTVQMNVQSGSNYELEATPNESVLVTTVTPNVLEATINLQQNPSVVLGENKPSPGLYNTGSGSGCGSGSGFATLFMLSLVGIGLTLARRRRE
jgi:hypothetical protein